MAKYKTADGTKVDAERVKGEDGVHDYWSITYPDGTVKESIDVNPTTGEEVFAKNYEKV